MLQRLGACCASYYTVKYFNILKALQEAGSEKLCHHQRDIRTYHMYEIHMHIMVLWLIPKK